jgi:hypothetical protein
MRANVASSTTGKVCLELLALIAAPPSLVRQDLVFRRSFNLQKLLGRAKGPAEPHGDAANDD